MKSLRKKGFALVVTLAVILLLSILVIGMLYSVRLDREASYSNMARTRADMAADWGVEDVVAQLRKYTAYTNVYWVSQPGRLIAGSISDITSTNATAVTARNTLTNEVILSSGTNSGSPASGVYAPAKLNLSLWNAAGVNERLISNGTNDMLLQWIYVRKNGDIDTSQAPSLTTTNPIVARYAYWADDEGTKLNVNLADSRTNTPTPHKMDPARIELSALINDPSIVQTIRNRITNAPGIPFNSILELNEVSGLSNTIQENKFAITQYNSSPRLSSDPIYLTTDRDLMKDLQAQGLIKEVKEAQGNVASVSKGLPNFIDIINYDINDPDPAYLPHLDQGKMNKTIAAIRTQLLRTDWPLSPGTDLITKWFGSGLSNVQKYMLAEQVALNIIDYVRVRESKVKLIPPISAQRRDLTATTTASYTFTSYSTKATGAGTIHYLGATTVNEATGSAGSTNNPNGKWIMPGRAPMISEMAMAISSTSIPRSQSGYTGGVSETQIANGMWWPQSTDQALNGDPSSQGSRQYSTTSSPPRLLPEVELYRCKIYVEIYLPPYEGLGDDFAIDFSKDGFAAWPGGEEGFAPEDVFARNTAGGAFEDVAAWFMSSPDEVETYPDNLLINKSLTAFDPGASTDKRNFLAYYFLNKSGNRVGCATVGAPFRGKYGYTSANALQPFTLANHSITSFRPQEFIGGSSKAVLRPGERIVIAKEYFRSGGKPLRDKAKMRVAIAFGARNIAFDARPDQSISASPPFGVMIAPYAEPIEFELQQLSDEQLKNNQIDSITSLQVNDPRLGWDPSQWKLAANTFGKNNTTSDVGKAPSAASDIAPQDTDQDGKITDYSIWKVPPPSGSTNSPGRVESVAELGVIHTGISAVTNKAVPWRTLRLQPNPTTYSSTSSKLPDWVLLSSFAAPPATNSLTNQVALKSPHNTARGGIVNMNTTIYPPGLTSDKRSLALAGLMIGAKRDNTTNFTRQEAIEAAQNVSDQVFADGNFKGREYGIEGVLDYPLEVLEYKGVADRGEASEEVVSELVNLGDNRSNVFTVYSIGQALQQQGTKSLAVLAEKRRQIMVERVENTTTSGSTIKTDFDFRKVYSRDLHP